MSKKIDLSKYYFLVPIAIFCCFLWGCAFPFIKIGYNYFNISSSDAPTQILFAGIRFFLAGLMVIIVGSFQEKKILLPKKNDWYKICFISLFQTVLQYIFFYIGLAHASGVNSAILISANIFFTLILTTLVFKQEKMKANKIIGILLGFLGIFMIFGFDTNISFLGEGFVLISAFTSSFSSVLMKKFNGTTSTMLLSGYQFFIGGAFMILVGLIFGGRITELNIKGILVLLYLAFISAAAYTLWGYLIKYNPVSKVQVMMFTNPIFGVILSAIFLNEQSQAFRFKNIIALLLVVFGIFIVNKEFKRGVKNLNGI